MTETTAIPAGADLWSPAVLQQRMLRLRQALVEAIDLEKMKAICESLIQQAIDGSLAAGKLLLGYALGRPERMPPMPAGDARVFASPTTPPPTAAARPTPAPTTTSVDMALFTPEEFQDLLKQTRPDGKPNANKRR